MNNSSVNSSDAVASIVRKYGDAFRRRGMTQRSFAFPQLLWSDDAGRFVSFGFEVHRYRRQWELVAIRVGQRDAGFDPSDPVVVDTSGPVQAAGVFGSVEAGLLLEDVTRSDFDGDVYPFFEQVRGVTSPAVYPSEALRRISRPDDYLPLIEQELFGSPTILHEILAWKAALGLEGNRQIRSASLLAELSDVFVANGVEPTVVDEWIAGPEPVELMVGQVRDVFGNALNAGCFDVSSAQLPVLEWRNPEGIALRFTHVHEPSVSTSIEVWRRRSSEIGVGSSFVSIEEAIHFAVHGKARGAKDRSYNFDLLSTDARRLLTDPAFVATVIGALV